jgi:RNA polymerase sigma-70 factor (ECF subfamily)
MIVMSAETESSLATRPSLLARLKDWSQQTAWREFDHDYVPLLRNVARKAGLTDAEADEVAQETLIAVAKKIGEFKHAGKRGSFRSWLYQQARWRIADQFRLRAKAAARPSTSLPAAAVDGVENTLDPNLAHSTEASLQSAQADHGFEQVWEAEWEKHVYDTAIARVRRLAGARQFQLFDLHVLQGLPVRAAAQAAGASSAAVFMAKSRMSRLVRREVERVVAALG